MADGNQFVATSKNTVNFNISGENDRIDKFRYRNNMLNDNFYDQVALELGNVYKKSVELGLMSQIDDTNNLYRMVTQEISKVYDNGIVRNFDDNDAIQEDMTLLYDELDVNELMMQSNLYINAFNDVLVQVGVKDDEINIKLRRPDNTIVKYNHDLELEEVFVYVGEYEGKQKWYGYTESEMFMVLVARPEDVLSEDTPIMAQDGMDDTSSTLGFLPFIAIHNGFRDGEFWQMYKGDDLVKGTVQIAIKLTFLNHLIKMQSFKQLVATGSNLKQLSGALLDPQSILMVDGNDTDIKTLDLESNYKALWETIQSINNNIAINYGISPNMFRLTATPTSGFGLQMENLKLDKYVAKQQKNYMKIEKDLFNLIKRVDETLGLGRVKSESVAVTFPPVQYPKTDAEQLEQSTNEIALGLSNQVSIIMERDGVDKETAEATYNENIKIRNQANEQFNGTGLNMETTAQDMGIV